MLTGSVGARVSDIMHREFLVFWVFIAFLLAASYLFLWPEFKPGAGSGFDESYCDIGRAGTVSGYSVEYENKPLSVYGGVVRLIDRSPNGPLVGDFLVCSGDYANPSKVAVSLRNHYFHWNSRISPEGSINNIHALPACQNVSDALGELREGDYVEISGYEVFRVTGQNGGSWSDRGCNTLLVIGVRNV